MELVSYLNSIRIAQHKYLPLRFVQLVPYIRIMTIEKIKNVDKKKSMSNRKYSRTFSKMNMTQVIKTHDDIDFAKFVKVEKRI